MDVFWLLLCMLLNTFLLCILINLKSVSVRKKSPRVGLKVAYPGLWVAGYVTIHDQNLSMIMWAKACMTRYMIPRHILKNISLEEAFTGVKPKIEHFRIYGCPVYFSCTQREKVQARPFREKGYIYGIVVNL
jgi:hypothetical protein